MSKPKRTKSGTGSAQGQKWEQGLLTTPFYEEGKWEASIVFVEGSVLEDYQLIEVLAGAVNAGVRKLFSVVTKTEVIEQVHELGNPKGKKPKEIPNFSEVCEPCKVHLDAGEDIPLPLLAKLLKFRLLDIKQKDVKRRETERRGGAAPPKSAGGKKGDKKERTKSPAKGKGAGKKTPEPPSPKGETKLRKRGEEDTDSKYIDDEPDDGPHHYIFVSGFFYPHLLTLMEDLGMPVDAVVKCTTEDYDKASAVLATLPQDQPPKEAAEGVEEDAELVKVQEAASLAQFWKDLLLVLQAAPSDSKLQDLARLNYNFKTDAMPESIEDPEKKLEYGTALFEDLACLVYDLYDWKRQWRNYLEHLRLLNVPLYGDTSAQAAQDMASQHSATPAAPPAGATGQPGPGSDAEGRVPEQVDMRCYNELMNSVPQESISIPLVMHCMLEQVVSSEEEREPPGETPKPPRADGLAEGISSHISNMAFKLALSEVEQKALASEFDMPKNLNQSIKQPKLLYYHDTLAQRLSHLQGMYGMDLAEAETELLQQIPLAGLAQLPRLSTKLSHERAARLQELMQFCGTVGLTQAEIDRAFKQFVFECMELSTVTENGDILPSSGIRQELIPWDDPYPYFKGTGDVDITALAEEVVEASRSVTSMSSESSVSSSQKSAASKPGSVEPAELTKELEGLQPHPPASQPGSARSGRSRSKKRSRKGSAKEVVLPPPEPVEPVPVKETSRPNSGILKSPARSREGSATSRKSSQSVHFETDGEGMPVPQPGDKTLNDGAAEEHSIAHSIDDVRHAQKRNLDQWCFAEHLEPNILQQVMVDASYTLPCMDTYYHRRDHSVLVAMHNPHGPGLTSKVSWEAKLHSNVGFRNYLEHISDSISDWTLEQEAKYEATLLAKEVDQIQKDTEDAGSRPGTGKGKKGRERSKSPKKSASRAGRSSSRGSSAERPSTANLLIREGSLKAQKDEMDKLRQEAEDAERAKADKRTKSAQKKASKENKEEKKPSSRSSSKSRMTKEVVETIDVPIPDEPQEPEPFWPFTGYDVGNNLIHVSGDVTTMFPADGAQIKTEKIQFEQGTTIVKTSLHKDGHLFHIHVLDPKDKNQEEPGMPPDQNETEKAETEKSEKDQSPESECEAADASSQPAGVTTDQPSATDKPVVGQFGSFNAHFNDDMSLAFSIYGAQGECAEGKKYEPVPYCPPLPRSPSPGLTAKESPTKTNKGKDKGKAATPEPVPSQAEEEEEEAVVEEPPIEQPFQHVYITCPDGLCVTYLLESELGTVPESAEDRRLVVRQSYPFKTNGMQECEGSRGLVQQEASRLITSDGTVVKFMTDGGVTLLYPSGQVSELSNYPPSPPSRSSSPQRAGSARSQNPERETPTKKAGRGRQKSANKGASAEEAVEEDPLFKSQCITTLPSGERLANHLDGTKIEVKDALVCVATDPQTHQALHTREDHVMTVCLPDQTTVVEHSDGTRITTYLHQVEVSKDDSESAETGEESQTEVQEIRFVRVECPGYATVKFDCATTECNTEFGNGTVIQVFPSGTYDVYHHDGTYLQVDQDGTSVVQPRSNNDLEVHDPNHELNYVLKHYDETLVDTIDNEGNHFTVTNMGESKVTLRDCVVEDTGEKSDCQPEDCSKKLSHFKQHAPRFFIIHPDGSGTELLRYHDVAEYLETAEDDPMTAILTDPLADHPGVLGITVLKPSLKDMSQKWLNGYTQETIIPPGLTSRDLKTMPAKEMKSEGPQLGRNVGQGLSIGSQVQSPPKLPVLRCPTVLELRQIIQYKPVSEELRERLTSGLREYAEYALARNADSDALLVQDPRSEEEKEQARQLQEGLVETMIDSTGRASRIEGDVKSLYEKATTAVIPSAPPTPQPSRTKADWERDYRERNQELENRTALRDHQVPPYFESELGKAFLLSQAPDMASLARELAEDRTLNCSVANNSSSATTPSPEQQQGDGTVTTIVDSPPSQVDGCSPAHGTTPSALRPGNPTPAHGMGMGSPAPLRPINPTPNHGNKGMEDRPGAPTPKEAAGQFPSETPSSHNYPSIPEMPYEEEYMSPENVPGDENEVILHRTEPVRLPAYIHGGRPGALENRKFGKIEDPVRRRVFTSSIAGATDRGSVALSEMRGFELLPASVNFGVLKEGNTYSFTVHLKNTGLDACRFKVRQPPPSTGLKICYKPGPVAAGMKAELTLELYAIAVGVQGDSGVGGIDHNLEIVTETDHLFLPVAAVLTAHEYEQQGKNGPRQGKAPGVRFVSNRPPGGQGIIRPRREGLESAA